MQNLIFTLLLLIFLKLLKDNIGIILSRKYLLFKSKFNVSSNIKFIVFIPIYNIKINDLISCINHFSKVKGVKSIFFLATKKDKAIKIKNYRFYINLAKDKKINLFVYPKKLGNKSDQINFGVETIFKEKKYNPHKTFILIYDIDSRPNIYTVEKLSFDKDLKYINIYQQSAIFLNNFFSLSNNLNRKLVRVFSLEQCRFTFAHEIPRLIFYFFTLKRKSFLNNFIYAHCVGHGLIIRGSFLKKYPLPSFYPEDMFYGFILNIIKEPIKPINTLDESSMPNTFRDIFFQRANWFVGPSYGVGYTSFFKKKYPNKITGNIFKICFLNIKSIYLCIKWMTTTLIFVFLILNLFSKLWFFKIISFLSIVLYILSYLNIIFVLKIIDYSLKNKFKKLKLFEQVELLLFSPIHLLIHSFTAYYKIFHSIIKKNISRID